jgi:hypothetical protein
MLRKLPFVFLLFLLSRRGGSGAWGDAPAKGADKMSDTSDVCDTLSHTSVTCVSPAAIFFSPTNGGVTEAGTSAEEEGSKRDFGFVETARRESVRAAYFPPETEPRIRDNIPRAARNCACSLSADAEFLFINKPPFLR